MADRIARLVGEIYEATLEQAAWPAVLAELTALTHARGVQVLCFDAHNRIFQGAIGGLPHECHVDYTDHYASLDPRPERARHWPDHVPWRDEDFMSDEEIARGATHQELFPRYDIYRTMGIKSRLADGGWFTTVLASWPKHPGFEPDQIARFKLLYSHLERAARIGLALGGCDLAAQGAIEAFERLDLGFVVCDRQGRIRHANHHARATLARGSGLCASEGNRLRAQLAAESGRLARLIGQACAERTGGDCRISRADQAQPLPVTVMPVSELPELSFDEPMAIVVFRDHAVASVPDIGALRDAYGLSLAEARLAAALLEGASLASYTGRAGIGLETARTLLKRAMAKTGTNRQGQFIATLLRNAAPLS